MKIVTGIFVVLFLVSAAFAAAQILQPKFDPFDLNLDFSHEGDTRSLGPEWEVVPVPKWPGVVQLFDRGQPATVHFPLMEAVDYQLRLKVLFQSPDGKLSLSLNGQEIRQWTPTKPGQAEKTILIVPKKSFRVGDNTLTWTNLGPARSVIYEQLRVRNFTSKIIKKHLYLVPGQTVTPRPIQPLFLVVILLISMIAAVIFSFLWSLLAGWPFSRSFNWTILSWLTGTLGLAISTALPKFAPYRFSGDLQGFILLAAICWGVGQVPVGVIAIALGLKRLVVSTVSLSNRVSSRVNLREAVAILAKLLGQFFLSLIRKIVLLFAAAVRWFLRNQSAAGYLKMAAGFLVVSWIFSLLKWVPWAVGFGHTSGVALVIAMVLRAVEALRRENSAAP